MRRSSKEQRRQLYTACALPRRFPFNLLPPGLRFDVCLHREATPCVVCSCARARSVWQLATPPPRFCEAGRPSRRACRATGTWDGMGRWASWRARRCLPHVHVSIEMGWERLESSRRPLLPTLPCPPFGGGGLRLLRLTLQECFWFGSAWFWFGGNDSRPVYMTRPWSVVVRDKQEPDQPTRPTAPLNVKKN